MERNHKATLGGLVDALTDNMSATDMLQVIMEIEISRNIRNARRKLGWSQKEFAERMGVTQSLVSRWESGECNYTIDTLTKIAVEMGLKMNCPLGENRLPDFTASPAKPSAQFTISDDVRKTIDGSFDNGELFMEVAA